MRAHSCVTLSHQKLELFYHPAGSVAPSLVSAPSPALLRLHISSACSHAGSGVLPLSGCCCPAWVSGPSTGVSTVCSWMSRAVFGHGCDRSSVLPKAGSQVASSLGPWLMLPRVSCSLVEAVAFLLGKCPGQKLLGPTVKVCLTLSATETPFIV